MSRARKNVVLYVNSIRGATVEALKEYESHFGEPLEIVVIAEEAIFEEVTVANGQKPNSHYTLIRANFSSPHSIRQALAPFYDRIIAVSSQFENSVEELTKIIPYLPYLETPTQSSLRFSTEKLAMRTHLEAHDTHLIPDFLRVRNASAETIEQIEITIPYPLVIKPSGLAGSQLVSFVNDRDTLQKELSKTFRVIADAYKHELTRREPIVLVEAFMQGTMYSMDIYVDKAGNMTTTPLVHVTTGRDHGFDDFFGYKRQTPTAVPEHEVHKAEKAAMASVKALHLRSTTAHVELMHTHNGWKIIELGPRMGGYRHEMYSLSFGINHIMNDILTRLSIEPIVPKTVRGHTAVFNLYAKSEGIIESFTGLGELKKLESFVSVSEKKQPGDLATFAKNNGEPVLSITLHHKDREQLELDSKAMEHCVDIRIVQ